MAVERDEGAFASDSDSGDDLVYQGKELAKSTKKKHVSHK